MKNVLCVLWHTKRHLLILNSKKIKGVAFVINELRLSEGIIESVSYSVSHSLENKLRSNFLKAFQVDLKSFWVVTNADILSYGKTKADFWMILFCEPCLLLCAPYYGPPVWFMTCKSCSCNCYTLLSLKLLISSWFLVQFL